MEVSARLRPQGVPFVGRAPFHESLAAQRTLLRAADQEVLAVGGFLT